jgi:hypothetical protein
MYEIGTIVILCLFAISGVVYLYVTGRKNSWQRNPGLKPLSDTERIADGIQASASNQASGVSKHEGYPSYGEDRDIDDVPVLQDLPSREERWEQNKDEFFS